ncbi:S-layer homology domain-containing protein [Pelosinus sp. UFO1]|uniref:S-layer homology domain-containing protein n=1 Tax=Pelosinus sp. UFO1 TaxID=484770 RepID=UPI0004D1FCE0|nr:S-layer homology domain-containing protein [Pelosinus sp. UFO1]AIF49736.1 hypothetical protein UFO1_0175 [Pelosinus sp. UFO1]
MRKKLLKTLILGSLLSVSATAFAANPFELVPTSNWTYDAIDKLVQAGVYEGYRDMNFSKQQTFTRYELATFVGKAMANQNKADTEQKATINKLATEFKVELGNLGVYSLATTPATTPATAPAVARVDKVKISGDTRFRYEHTKSTKFSDDVNFRTRFNVDVDLDDTWKFRTRFVNSNNITAYDGNDDSGSSTTKVDLSFVKGTVGDVGVSLGRLPLALGKGMLVDTDKNWNGAKFDFGDKIKAQVGYARAGDKKKAKYFFTDVTTNLTKDLDVTASYLKDSGTKIDAAEYKAWTAGFGYNGLKNLAVVGEYGKNSVKSAKAWMTGLTFRQADRKKVGSWSASTIYRKAAPGFDPQYWSTVDASYAVENSAMDDIQGIEYAVDYVPMKGAILHVSYGDMKNYAGDSSDNRQYFISNLSYKF